MKLFLFGLGLSVTCMAKGAPVNVQVLYDNKAILHLCAPDAAGCVTKIQLGKKLYSVALAKPSDGEDFENLVGAYLFHKMQKTQPGKVSGFLVNEKGHMPNPTVASDVFYALSFDFVVPR